MSERAHEIEALVLAMFAAVPLYVTQTISPIPLIAFHAAMLAITISVATGHGPEVIPAKVMRGLAIAYVVFYVIDAVVISRSAIAASTHLVLFIAVYQPIEALLRRNHAQRLLTAALIFTASIATATHVTIVPFVIVFGFIMFRQLIHIAHLDTIETAQVRAIPEPRSTRPAAFYLCGTTVIGMLFFPILPRVRNPLVPGLAGSLSSSTGLSETIDFNQQRTITPDATVISRVSMPRDAIPFFTPLRLRGTVYERFQRNQWLPGRREFVPLDTLGDSVRIARPSGFTRRAVIQQRFVLGTRLFLPVGTFEIDGVPAVAEAPTRDTFVAWQSRREVISYEVRMARETTPMQVRRVAVSNFPVTPEIAAMARRIVGRHTDPMAQSRDIEEYLSSKFSYIPDPSQIGHRMTVDDFLLHEHRGHCEYFAAGMVALLTALDVPARIVGGFYGGKLNPLTGYFIVRREDAHAWVEVFDGDKWRTFDPTPASLRPGNTSDGLVRAYASALSDSVNYFWDRYILTFGLADQIALAADMIDRVRGAFVAFRGGARRSLDEVLTLRFASFVAMLLAAGAIVVLIVRRRRSTFELLRAHLRRLGIDVGEAMTMEEALLQLRRTHAGDAARLEPLIALYEAERFSSRPRRGVASIVRRRLAELSPSSW